MLLLELFDNNAVEEWKWEYKDPNKAKAVFTIEKVEYIFYAFTTDTNEWELEFSVDIVGNRYGLTGTGNSQKVMSTIVAIIKDFLKYYKNIEKISFEAKEKSRISLYAKMIHRLIPNWKLTIEDVRKGGTKRFVLTKKDTK